MLWCDGVVTWKEVVTKIRDLEVEVFCVMINDNFLKPSNVAFKMKNERKK